MTNTLSNQDFAGLAKFRLRTSLGEIKEIRVKINKTKKINRNQSSMSDFFSSPFSFVMANLTVSSSAVESASLTLDKTESLESKFLRPSSEKISSFQGAVSLLNQCIGKENVKLRF